MRSRRSGARTRRRGRNRPEPRSRARPGGALACGSRVHARASLPLVVVDAAEIAFFRPAPPRGESRTAGPAASAPGRPESLSNNVSCAIGQAVVSSRLPGLRAGGCTRVVTDAPGGRQVRHPKGRSGGRFPVSGAITRSRIRAAESLLSAGTFAGLPFRPSVCCIARGVVVGYAHLALPGSGMQVGGWVQPNVAGSGLAGQRRDIRYPGMPCLAGTVAKGPVPVSTRRGSFTILCGRCSTSWEATSKGLVSRPLLEHRRTSK